MRKIQAFPAWTAPITEVLVMRLKKFGSVTALALLATVLAACNLAKTAAPTPDVNALYTAAAGTLLAQFSDQQTQTAGANSPTPLVSPTPLASFTPLPTFPIGAGLTPFGTFTFGTPAGGLTALPTLAAALPAGTVVSGFAQGCNNAVFMGETIPDGTKMSGGKVFKKFWQLQNTGTCAWGKGYAFDFKSGDQMEGAGLTILNDGDVTEPGHSNSFGISMKAPTTAGEYKGYWQMKDDKGTWFGSLVSVDIIVQ
jgi:hypothetical protein